MKKLQTSWLFGVGALAAFGFGCSPAPSALPPPNPSSPSTTPPVQQVWPSPEKKIEQTVDSNHLIGFITKITQEKAKNVIEFDPAQWFSGEDAEKAAREDGFCPDGDFVGTTPCLSNPFYIRNNSTSTQTLVVSPTAMFKGVSSTNAGVELVQLPSFSAFRKYLDHIQGLISSMNPAPDPQGVYAFGPLVYVSLKNGVVTVIEEQYLP